MCYHILDTETNEIIVQSMVRSAEHTTRPNEGLESKILECRQEDTVTKLRGENCPIITYYGNSVKDKSKNTPPIKIRHHIATFDPEALLDLYIYDTHITRNGKTRENRGQVKKYLGNKLFMLNSVMENIAHMNMKKS